MRKFDPRWLYVGVILATAIVVAVNINNNHNTLDANRLTDIIDIDNGDQNINWDKYQTVEIELEESYLIAKSGIYRVSGNLIDGQIKIDAGVGEVKLILDDVSIKNPSGPAIYCAEADDLVIELVGENNLTDGTTYSSEYDEDVTGTIYSKADLTFTGDGSLSITSNYEDAIVGKDDVKFKSGTYEIQSTDDAIRGKDSVYIVDGNFKIETVADAIKTTNEINPNKGFVLIENGTFDITSSAKGIKATDYILIKNGEFALNTFDDAIHSNNYVSVSDGQINIDSGDDGIHADNELIMEGGSTIINRAYEGLEAQKVTINGGLIELNTKDDGINAGGGDDASSKNRPGANPFNTDENCIITINNGNIYINSTGDGIDSNGALFINGGKTVVDGPVDNGNGALDAGLGIIMKGGEVIAVGSSGMAESLGVDSHVNNLSIFFDKTLSAGTLVTIKDSTGNTVLEHTSAKAFNHLAAGSEQFSLGEIYIIYLNSKEYQKVTLKDVTTTIGNNHNSFDVKRTH